MEIWKPHQKQEKALLSTCFETLYGGARGGGKTDAGMIWLLYDIQNPRYRALVIRKNSDDLKDWIDRARRMYSGQNAEFVGHPAVVTFPSGAKIYTGHLKDENAYTKYQGHEYQRMLVEELTQIPSEDLYLKLISSCRTTVDGLMARIFATTNPGGVGHNWVKRRFVDVSKDCKIHIDKISKRSRVYIPATVQDNPTLQAKDPSYILFLDSLAPDLRAQWRHGSWEQVKFKGQIYGDELNHAKESGRIYDFQADEYAETYAIFDLGKTQSDSMAITFAQQHKEQIKVIDYHESYNKKWSFYAQLIKEKSFSCRRIVLPHDGTKRDGETLKSLKDFFEEEGFEVTVLVKTNSIPGDIQTVKTVFSRVHFASVQTIKLLEALEQYRYKWNDALEVPSNEPEHNWTSHPADSFRYLCLFFELLKSLKKEVNTDNAWDNLGSV